MTEYHFDSDVSRVLLSRADGFDQRSNGSFWHGVGPIVSTFEREGRRSDAILRPGVHRAIVLVRIHALIWAD